MGPNRMSSAVSTSTSPYAHMFVTMIVLAYLLSSHLALADGSQNVRLPARFGKRAEEDRGAESGGGAIAGNSLIKLLTSNAAAADVLLNPNEARLPTDRQLLSSLLASMPLQSKPLPGTAALGQLSSPARVVLVPVLVEHKGNSQQARLPNSLSTDKSGGPNWW